MPSTGPRRQPAETGVETGSVEEWTWARERCKSRHGLRVGCGVSGSLDQSVKCGDIGEDAGVDGVSVKTPAGQPHQNPGTAEILNEGPESP